MLSEDAPKQETQVIGLKRKLRVDASEESNCLSLSQSMCKSQLHLGLKTTLKRKSDCLHKETWQNEEMKKWAKNAVSVEEGYWY